MLKTSKADYNSLAFSPLPCSMAEWNKKLSAAVKNLRWSSIALREQNLATSFRIRLNFFFFHFCVWRGQQKEIEAFGKRSKSIVGL